MHGAQVECPAGWDLLVPLNMVVPAGSVVTAVFIKNLVACQSPVTANISVGINTFGDFNVGPYNFNPWSANTVSNLYNPIVI
jgi:hypothetical protein